MARVTGPLMSMDASGTIGGSITFAKWKGRNYVRRRVVPHNPQSEAQTATRAMMRFLTQAWALISGGDQATWDDQAASEKISPFNRYIQVNMREFTQFLFPSTTYPIDRISTPPAALTVTATAGIHEVNGTLAPGSPAPTWGLVVLLAAAITPARSDCQLIIPAQAGATVSFTVPNVKSGNYTCQGLGFNLDGVVSAASNAVSSIIVT